MSWIGVVGIIVGGMLLFDIRKKLWGWLRLVAFLLVLILIYSVAMGTEAGFVDRMRGLFGV